MKIPIYYSKQEEKKDLHYEEKLGFEVSVLSLRKSEILYMTFLEMPSKLFALKVYHGLAT